MQKIKIRKEVSKEGKIKWKLFINGEEMQRIYRTSRLLTGSMGEYEHGIFTSGAEIFYWGDFSNTIEMLPTFKINQTAQKCLVNLVKNIQAVRAWVDKVKQENIGEQVAQYELKF